MNLFNKTIAELVHFELVKQNIQLIDLAKKLNVDERTVRYFNEANTSRHYKLQDLYRIARILKIDITELLPNEKSLKKYVETILINKLKIF
ncbi:hypothetical protein ACSXEL_17130 (plasmid) [Clostridium perfringens]